MLFWEKLYKLRIQKNLSQEKLAEILLVSRQSVAKWETGKAYPEIEKLIQISDYFNVSIDSLVRQSEYDADNISIPKKPVPYEQLISFLLKAKQNAYASKAKEQPSCRPSSHDWEFRQGELLYIDSYLGGNRFSGQEAVWEQNTPVWTMNYTGRILSNGFSGDFLKSALLLGTIEQPYRGPSLYQNGQYTYHNTVSGTFEWYQGNEDIFCEDKIIYECRYHGGLLFGGRNEG